MTIISVGALLFRGDRPLSDPLAARTPGITGFFGVLSHWDSTYYLNIAQHGYFFPKAFAGLPAIFPGYPLLARELAAPFGGGTDATEAAFWFISAFASLAAGILLWRLVSTGRYARSAPWATLLFLAGPYSIFLSANYAEGLFCALAIGAWYAAGRDRWWLAGILCGAASFVRINGIFLAAALMTWYLMSCYEGRRRLRSVTSAWLLVAISGLVVYFWWLAGQTGNLMTWLSAERIGWNREFQMPWSSFYQTAGRVLMASTVDRRFQYGMDILVASAVLWALIVFVRRRAWPEAVYVGLTLLSMVTSYSYISLARTSVVLFPATILLARSSFAKPAVGWPLLVGMTSLFALNTVSFAFGFWTD